MATLGTILSSVQDGKVKLSDPVSMVLFKDFRQVSLLVETLNPLNHGRLTCLL